MKKKKLLSLLLMVSITGTTFFLNSGTIIDPVLENATLITRKIFYENLKEGEEVPHGYFSSSYLKGVDGQEDYILSQCATGGYAIFEKESMELIEYSDTDFSPYTDIESEGYYLGPSNYYFEKEGKIQNINTGKSFEKENLSYIANDLKERFEIDREKREELLQAEREELLQTEQGEMISEYSLQETVDQNPGPTGDRIIDADDYVVEMRNYIPNYQFFVENEGFGDNQNGTCVTVATQLLLSYNNWANDGRIITEQQIDGNEVFFLNGREQNRNIPYSPQMIGTTSSDFKFDDETSFYEILKGYINPLDWSDDENRPENADEIQVGATMSDAYNGINQYLTKYAPVAKTNITMDYSLTDIVQLNGAVTKLTNEINAGRPAIGSIYVYTLNEDGTYSKGGHAVLVYGTQTITFSGQNLNGFIAHFGWHHVLRDGSVVREFTNIWFNSSWVKGYLTFQTSHVHSDFTELDDTNHVFACGVCQASVIRNHHYSTDILQGLPHDDIDFHECHLSQCGCGYITKYPHLFQYSPSDTPGEHIKSCRCGYLVAESHFYKNSELCWYCKEP